MPKWLGKTVAAIGVSFALSQLVSADRRVGWQSARLPSVPYCSLDANRNTDLPNPSLAKLTQSRRWSKLLYMSSRHTKKPKKERKKKKEPNYRKERDKKSLSNPYSGWMAPKIARIQNLLNTTTKYTNMALAHTHTHGSKKKGLHHSLRVGVFFFLAKTVV